MNNSDAIFKYREYPWSHAEFNPYYAENFDYPKTKLWTNDIKDRESNTETSSDQIEEFKNWWKFKANIVKVYLDRVNLNENVGLILNFWHLYLILI